MGHKVSSNKNTIWKWEKADLDARLFVVGGLEWEQTGTGWPQYYKLCVNVYNYQYMFKYKFDRTSMALPGSWGPRCFAIVLWNRQNNLFNIPTAWWEPTYRNSNTQTNMSEQTSNMAHEARLKQSQIKQESEKSKIKLITQKELIKSSITRL